MGKTENSLLSVTTTCKNTSFRYFRYFLFLKLLIYTILEVQIENFQKFTESKCLCLYMCFINFKQPEEKIKYASIWYEKHPKILRIFTVIVVGTFFSSAVFQYFELFHFHPEKNKTSYFFTNCLDFYFII